MNDETGTQGTSAGSPGTDAGTGPRPEPLRFFGTTWVNHDNGYTPRRLAAAAGSLAAAVASCLILRFAYQGLQIADVGSFVTLLVTVMFAVCSALAFGHTWESFKKRPDPDRQASLRGLLGIGFVGSLVAYFLRSLTEAPGEQRHREEYETAVAQHEKRTTRRTRNPSKKRRRS
ncbi:EamA/RhaT family transporter [Streptomyces sp. NPDC050548]|uniref:EamA/RhaT family transporter n=1 Tax=Streptomyces sp. NPDC050548 TaxID=3365629 RepID=UPI0037BBC8DF